MRALAAARHASDDGAVVLIVAIMFAAGLVFTLLALVVDLGAMFDERQQDMNAADAAASALAQRCAFGESECASNTEAATLANANARDGAVTLAEVCGAAQAYWPLAQRLPACAGAQATSIVNDCAPVDPLAYPNYVRVRSTTLTSAGEDSFPSVFGSVFSGQDQELSSAACAQVAWGLPDSAMVAMPFMLPICPGNLDSGPFQLLDFFANDPTQTCDELSAVTRGWALGDIYKDGLTCDTGVELHVGDIVQIQPSTSHVCGDPNTIDRPVDVLTRHLGSPSVVPVVGAVQCTEKDKNGQPKKNCGQGSYEFTIVGFKAFTLLGFNLHNSPPVGQTPAGGWLQACGQSRDCVHGSLSPETTTGDISPAQPNPDLDFGVRVITPLP